MSNLDSVLKSKELSLPTKVFIGKAMVFSVVMFGCGNFTIMKSECQRYKKQTCEMVREHHELNGHEFENSSRYGNTIPPDLPPEKSVCRSRSWTWNKRLVPNR